MTDYEIVREACIKANPARNDLGENATCTSCDKQICSCEQRTPSGGWDENYERPIRLADVLLAVGEKHASSIGVNSKGQFYDERRKAHHYWTAGGWNLRADTLSMQSPETVKFLADLVHV